MPSSPPPQSPLFYTHHEVDVLMPWTGWLGALDDGLAFQPHNGLLCCPDAAGESAGRVEDGGKAALSRKMRPGDELVNINGTPLYGSRQEALVLIKGSYRTLKMIVRRRNVPVIRPHSWHLAKLSEVRTEAATMHCPSDAFSLSWHSGCDSSDLSLQWAQLSRHCSTEKSSSIGSMESLDPPGQTYYEGSLSPVDQSMYQNKRDSAYSSFSASSNASDYALSLCPEETSSTDSILQGLGPSRAHEGRYLQTGSEGADVSHQLCGHLAPNSRPSSCPHESNLSGSTKSGAPPQPPVRRDSLRASNPQPAGTERRRASAPADALYFPGRWTSDTSLCLRDKEPEGVGGHPKEHLSADQYYMLSSHLDRRQPSMEPLLGESTDHPQGAAQGQCQDNSAHEGQPGTNVDPLQSPRKGHRHSAPEQLLASQLLSLNVATGSSRWDTQLQDRHQWTVNPLHLEQPGLGQQTEDAKEQPCGDPATGTDCADDHATQAQHSPGQAQDSCHSQEPYRCYPELERSCSTSSKSAMPPQPASLTPACSSKALVEEGKESGQSRPSARKSGPSHQRSAQLRRRSERFATNLRNEIQRRKAQLQKSKGSVALLCGEEPVEETDEPCESHPNPSAPPQGRLPSSGDRSSVSMAQARAKCLSPTPGTAPAGEHGRSPGRPANRSAPTPQPARKGPSTPAPDKEKQRAPGTGGRWRWSPEHKLQRALSPGEAYAKGPEAPASPLRLAEDAVLLPFADRRKFFEETSRCVAHLPARHSKPPSFRPKAAESHAFQSLGTECRELRRCSVDQSYPPLSPGRQNLPTYAECCLEPPVCYAGLPRHGEFEYLRPFARACAGTAPVLHESCLYCSGNMCPALLQRNMQSSHHGYRCHPHPWVPRCSDCCCSVPHKALEETEPWPGRKAFLPEFPLEEWEPGVINRKGSQSVRPDGLSEVVVKETPRWDTGRSVKDEQYQVISWGQERLRPSPPCLAPEQVELAQESAEVESCRLGRQPPCRMTSEELMRDVAGRDRSLAGVLSPASSMVTAAEVMGELFSAGDRHSWKDHYQQDWRLEKQSEVEAQEREEFQRISPPLGGAVSPTSYSAYYNTSAGKAELLNKMKELPEGTSEEEEVDHELAQKKAQLIESISRKLAVLQEAQRGLQEDINANAALGEEVECQVKGVCKPNEFDKFRLFIGDLDKVVNLLLSLSGRLARVENALNSLDHVATEDEKLALLEKKRQLTEQLEDAKDLKEHVDRRERAVFGTISHSLPAEQLQDYQHFVKMKSALIIEQRELEEKIKLGEEQLRCLRESLLLGPRDY
ncbi:protein Shroom4 isoform X4 [Mauremys mutica]|uniref:protein Shroom4 isoform X4 n=1 Tax=Mauremys mutica TaxID=74926 RepID=UPI001D16EBF8|nr:protein Shroom4 isoform X4 [Mauremys mutica]